MSSESCNRHAAAAAACCQQVDIHRGRRRAWSSLACPGPAKRATVRASRRRVSSASSSSTIVRRRSRRRGRGREGEFVVASSSRRPVVARFPARKWTASDARGGRAPSSPPLLTLLPPPRRRSSARRRAVGWWRPIRTSCFDLLVTNRIESNPESGIRNPESGIGIGIGKGSFTHKQNARGGVSCCTHRPTSSDFGTPHHVWLSSWMSFHLPTRIAAW